MSEEKKSTAIDLKNLKAGGFIKERGKDLFTVRLRVPGGRLPVERLRKIVEVAEKYGQGEVLPELSTALCIGCGLCVKSCSDAAITMGADNRPVFSHEHCTWCGDCVKVCPTEAWKAAPRSLKAEGHRLLSLQENGGYYLLTLEKGEE